MEQNVLSPTKTPFISLYNVFRCFVIPSGPSYVCDSDILSTPSWAWSVKLSTKTDVTCIFSFFSQGERGWFISLRQHFVTEDYGGAGQPWMRQAKPPQLCRGQNCGHQFEDPSQQGWFCWEGGNACLYEIFKCINFGWFSVSCLLWPQWERH